ncbi:MAG: CocE/NonD family hydrolase [Pseudohongiella sp.]|nr:CocE/NonD family hydrolase [Pseudohongiella sp.]
MSTILVLSNVMVPMRDGVQLATDIYLPDTGGSIWPVIMERTPYNKAGVSRSECSLQEPTPRTRAAVAMDFAAHGFAVVMQDCRGRYGSEGTFTKYLNEAEDGYDTLLWLTQQAWCNGRIGTMGLSYGAHTQSALACLNPPGLACMFMDSGGFSSAYHGGIRRGGAFELKQATWAYKHALLSTDLARDPQRLKALQSEDIKQWFLQMPWYPGHSPLRHSPEYEQYFFEQWQHGQFDDYWKKPGLYAEGFYDQFPDVPVTIIGSWYDPYVRTCLNNFSGLAARKKSAMNLIMGPWTHGDRSRSYAGDVDFGAASVLDGNIATDYFQMRLDWFKRCLLSAPSEKTDTPQRQVSYFTMGGGSGLRNAHGRLQHDGHWQHSGQWPPENLQPAQLLLCADGMLRMDNIVSTDEHVYTAAPDTGNTHEDFLEFVFDPANPVPTMGGALTSGDPVMFGGAFDQQSDNRDDVLVFQTPVLTEDLEVTGAIEAHLWISSDQPDTDFTVKLIDVYPPSDDYPRGYAMNITDGILRVRYREGFDREVMMTPGTIYKIVIEPFASSNRFCKGHRLRLDISSSNFPHFDINPNTGAPEGSAGERRRARNRVYCSARYPSCLLVGDGGIKK